MMAYLLAQGQQPQRAHSDDSALTANGDTHPRQPNGDEPQQPS